MKNRSRYVFVVLFQILIIITSLFLSYSIRFDFDIDRHCSIILEIIPVVLLIKLPIFWKFGLFKGWWRYVSMYDLSQILKANLVSSLIFVLYAVMVYRLDNVPRSVLFLDGVFCFLLIGGVRFLTRAVRENFLPALLEEGLIKKRAIIVGAGNAGQMIVREIKSNKKLEIEVIGFVDDDSHKKKSIIQGIKVLGSQKEIPDLVRSKNIDEIIIAIPSATGQQIKKILDRCKNLKVEIKLLPGVGDLITGNVSVQALRDIKLEDLLGRKPISLDQAQISSYLHGKRVLVTGAGGSIGSEVCRQVARFYPEKLILYENSETPLFLIEQELIKSYPDIHIVPIVGDIRNHHRLNVIFDEQLPQVVFHAAAYKHVPMMETNPAEAVNNNVRGTMLLADIANEIGVETFVMISTDKAVRPTNIMGATKRVAELYVQALSRESKTRFVTTRFGNVLGSNGSVIPTFQEQIKNGGPVTVTHPEVTRFFMTIPEATQLVLQAGSMGRGGEIYLFDMGEPVKIKYLAEELIRLSGLTPYEDIEIVFTGLRPGEKLFEELLLEDEGVLPTHHNKICIAKTIAPSREKLTKNIYDLLGAATSLDIIGLREGLKMIVPEYTPTDNHQKAKILLHPARQIAN